MNPSPSPADYVRAGYALVRIPHDDNGRPQKGPKGPGAVGWNLRKNAICTIEAAEALNGCNFGIAHAWSRTCCWDVDDYLTAVAWLSRRGIALDVYLAADDAVQIVSGRPNRAKLCFRLPDGVAFLPHVPANGRGFECRSASRDGTKTLQDCLPPSVHPDTGQPYTWKGDWKNFPILPEVLLALWRKLVNGPRPSPGRAEGGKVQKGSRNAHLTSLGGSMRYRGFSEAAIRAALLVENQEKCGLSDAEAAKVAASVAKYAPGQAREPPVEAYEEDARRYEPGFTDLGNAHRFAQEHLGNVRYCWPWLKWLVWNGRYWSCDDTGAIHRLAEATVRGMYEEASKSSSPEQREALATWALKCESHERRVKMLASARAIAGVPVLPKDLDWDAWLLNVRNGTLDLRTGTLRPHAREDLITRGIDVDYTPGAKCPTWERFLAEVFRNDAALIAFVQRAVGYSLTGDIREHVFFILFGRGSNGKSTFLDVIHALLGPYAGPVPAELLLTRRGEHHPTERATLFSKRFVATVESGDGRRLAEDRVKAITGGDPIECRRMKEDFWVFTPTHKLWFGTNHKPVVKGTDHAIWRRIRLVPFETTFHEPETGGVPQKDPALPERLIEELPGILVWGVSGCLAWQREGLKAPEAVRDATEGYRVEMDVLARFLDECCVFNKSAEARASDLYKAYTSWCETAHERVESQSSFGQRLTEKGCERYRNNGIWYLGVGLRA